jgi:hypothetical protein
VSEDPDVFLRTLITNIARIAKDNYEFIFLANTEKSGATDPLRSEFVEHLSKYIEHKLPNRKMDYDAFALTLYACAFMISQTKYHEHGWFNHDKALEGFIKNSLVLIH